MQSQPLDQTLRYPNLGSVSNIPLRLYSKMFNIYIYHWNKEKQNQCYDLDHYCDYKQILYLLSTKKKKYVYCIYYLLI